MSLKDMLAECARERPELCISRPTRPEIVHSAPILLFDGSMKPRRRSKRVVFRVIDGGKA